MGLNALQSYAASLSGEEELNQSLRRGFQRNPVSYAQALQRMKATGVAPDLQEGMEPELDLDSKVQAVPVQDIIRRHPVLAKYLKNEEFATLAQDDIKPLMGISTAVRAIPELKPWTPTGMDRVKDFFRGLMEGTTFASDEEAQAIRQAESARIRTATQMGVNPAEFHTGNASTLPASRIGAGIVRGAVRPMAGFARYAERKAGIDTGIWSGLQGLVETLTPVTPTVADTSVESFSSTLGLLIPSLGIQKAVSAFGKIPALAKMPALIQKAGAWSGALAMAIPEAASEAQDVYDQLKAQGVSDEEASRKSDRVFLGNSALLAVTDKIGWFSGGGIGRRAIAEAIQEGSQTGMSNAATGEPILHGVPSSMLMGAAVATAIPILGKAVGSLIQTNRMRVQDTQEFLKDLSEGVKSTQIAQVAPEKVQEFIQAAGGQESLLIPAQRYFQSVTAAGVDPVALADQLGVENLEEAMVAGTDIVIPTGAYATQIAPTELHPILSPDIRLNPGDPTLRELEEVEKSTDQSLLNEITEEAQNLQTQAEIDALPIPEIEKYRESVKQAFVGGGVAEDTASAMADLWIRPVQTFIESGDITAEQAAQLWPLDVSAYRKGEEKKSITDIVLDRLKEFGHGVKEYFQSAFHGSPYRFDKFSLEHMGKGEGAQAYGWGLYFAGAKDVAEYYRRNLSAKEAEVIFTGKSGMKQTLGPNGREGVAARFIITNEGNIDAALLELQKGAESFPNDQTFTQAYEWLKRNRDKLEYRPKDTGQLYEADIPEDNTMLLWDKPLSEQPEAVKKAVGNLLGKVEVKDDSVERGKKIILVNGEFQGYAPEGSLDAMDGSRIYALLGRVLGGTEVASKTLNHEGISGIKYLDGSSRSEGEGSYNYVVFDDNAVKILKTFYQSEKRSNSQVETPEFKQWFKSSRVVDEDGKPIVVQHATDAEFTRFSSRHLGENTDGNASDEAYAQTAHIGHWFADRGANNLPGKASMPVYLKIENPIEYGSLAELVDAIKEAGSGVKLRKQLQAKGYDGIRLLDEEFQTTSYVAFDPRQIKSATGNRGTFNPSNPDILYQRGGGRYATANEIRRGFIQFGNERIHIGLLEGRNLSTLLHETSHAFLQMLGDVAEMPNASERTKTLWADTLKELGVESREQIGSEQHEKFAEWGERYFMEGKSPSESLKPLMVRFQAWMQLVYKTLEKLGVKINKEVRSVFDRLLATDAEIAAVSDKPELFTSAEDMGATPAEYAVLVEAKAKAIQEGHDRLQVEVMQDLVREQKKAYKDEKAQARAEVEAGVDSRPDMKAMAALKDGTIKLDRKSVEEQFGTTEGIPTVEDGGMEIGYVADLLGYENGASLYNALKNLPDRNGLIDALTEEIINARYGDVLMDGSIAEKAVDAMHGDRMGDVLAMELRHLMRLKRVTDKVQAAKSGEEKAAQKAADIQIPSVSTVREQARELISRTNLRNMNANKYRLAEEKYSREAYKLKGKKDYAGAAEAKIKELMNHFLYIEARNTKAFEERRASEVRRKLRNKEFLGMLGKAGKAFQDAWLQICDEYEFEKVSGVKLDERRASLLELQKAHEDAGIDIDPAVLTAIPKNYRELTMIELRAIHEALTNIEHVASETQKVMVGNEKMDVDSVARELVYAAMTNNKVKPLRSSGETVGRVDKAAREIQGLNAYMKQMIRIIDQLDGGDPNGIWHRAIWQVWSDAHGRELELGGAINAKIQELIEKTGIFSKSYLDQSIGVRLPGEESDLNHRRAIGFLFNLGSQENRNAMRGWIVNPDGFPSPVIDEILSKISKQEADFVQGVWDVLESMWPAIEAQEMRQKGITPTRKTATPIAFKTRDGVDVELRGGYFPLAGEPFERVGKIQMSGDLSQITESGYTYATTSRSHTKEVTGAAYRVNLDFGFVLGKHLTGVIKDLTHREAVLSMNRILAREDVSKALLQSIGPEMEAEFMPWLKATVNNRNAGPQEGGKLLQWLMQRRHGMVIAQLALNISSIVIQTPDMFKVWTEVPAVDLVRAFATLMQNPVKTINAIRELSPNRMRNFERDYHRDLMQFFESRNFLEQQKGEFVEWSMVPFQIMGQFSAFPAWLGTFQKGMAEHGDQARAVREADTVVDRVVQFGDPAHLSRMMREKGWTSLFTMFQGDLNIWYNIITSATGEHKAPKVAKSILAYCLSGILGNLLVGRGPKDDEDWREWAILKALIGIPELIPVVGDAVKAGVAHLQGKPLASQQYSPVFGAILKPFVAGAEIKKQVQEGGNAADAAFSTIDAVGTWTGFPGTAQTLKTSKYLKRLKEGEERPDDATDVVQGVLFNKRSN